MSTGFNQNWGVEEMMTFIGISIGETVQHCGWVHNGMVCNTPLKTKDFNAHLRARHGINSDAVLHQCHWYDCNALPMTKSALERHVKEQHVPGRWACPACLDAWATECRRLALQTSQPLIYFQMRTLAPTSA
ncbi:hypothetical protein PAXINDRAFT_103268 [Paxillus involutus ATCC 200175]|uniref:Uncharacterized protein n=1 Tax=Paxillus involutus ATCC 200175 TaxID=664439 RepID=A0A0C9THC1_PAXIN|nr:hypothetical protein PAXINDRAFT_103268 [Paxillus involutus ATCC 200175]